jgi:hypothetical protein
VTRLWPHGAAVPVQCDPAGAIQAFAWDGVWRPVAAVARRWRVRAAWWAPEGETWQEYVKLTTADGLLCVLAHDLRDDAWRLVRLYD